MVEVGAVCRVSRAAFTLICQCKAGTWATFSLHSSYATTVMASKYLILQPSINDAVHCPSPISSSSFSFLGPLSFPPSRRMRGQMAPSLEAMPLLHGSLCEWAGSTTLDCQWNHPLRSEHESARLGHCPISPVRQGPALLLPMLILNPAHPHLPCLLQTTCLQPAHTHAAAFLLIYVSILQFLPSEISLKVSSVLHRVQAVMILSACARSS